MRKCTKCGVEKELSSFYAVPVGDRISRQCKECKKEYEKIRRKEHPEIYKDYDLRKDFDLTLDEYVKKSERQNSVCAICKKPETHVRLGKLTVLRVDHSHVTGENRGLLCNSCNAGLGFFQDSPELLITAAQYLKSFEQENECQ